MPADCLFVVHFIGVSNVTVERFSVQFLTIMDKKNIYSAARFDRFEKAESERVHQISKTHKNSTPPTYIVSVRPDGQINLFNIWPITTTQICRMAIFYPNKFKISPKYSVTLNVFSKTFFAKVS